MDGIKIVEQRKQYTAQQHQKQLNTDFSTRLSHLQRAITGHIKELLDLSDHEFMRIGEGDNHQNEEPQQYRCNDAVVMDIVGYRVACHPEASTRELGVVERILREEPLSIVLRQLHVKQALSLAWDRQMRIYAVLLQCHGFRD